MSLFLIQNNNNRPSMLKKLGFLVRLWVWKRDNLNLNILEKLAAGGIGYVDFRTATISNLSSSSSMLAKSHLIVWQT